MKSKFFKTVFVAIIVVMLVLVFDMLTKYLLIGRLIPNVGDQASFIEGFINFVHVQNDGASGGILGGQTALLILLTIALLIALGWYYFSKIKTGGNYQTLLSVAIGFVVGGSLGNLYDRLFFGYVRDFINFQFIDFPVFNIADSAITIGVILLVIYFLCEYIFAVKKEKKRIEIEEIKEAESWAEASKFNEGLAEIWTRAIIKKKTKKMLIKTAKKTIKNKKNQKMKKSIRRKFERIFYSR